MKLPTENFLSYLAYAVDCRSPLDVRTVVKAFIISFANDAFPFLIVFYYYVFRCSQKTDSGQVREMGRRRGIVPDGYEQTAQSTQKTVLHHQFVQKLIH